jgi:Uma2 family endonuclease
MSVPAIAARPQVEESPRLGDEQPLVLHFGPLLKRLTEQEFFDFCQWNSFWRIELTAEGDLIVMPPAGSETGNYNFNLSGLFAVWVRQDGTGLGFDSSTGFTLPNGARRSPDLAWIRRERWEQVPADERKRFAPICPDFVVELRSPTDSLTMLQGKLVEYIANGAQLGWLIDPLQRKVYVYRPGAEMTVLEEPKEICGDPVLPGFALELAQVWS